MLSPIFWKYPSSGIIKPTKKFLKLSQKPEKKSGIPLKKFLIPFKLFVKCSDNLSFKVEKSSERLVPKSLNFVETSVLKSPILEPKFSKKFPTLSPKSLKKGFTSFVK